ncbi:hypothetical protein DFJ74DRAFT_766382 [Hyaloraphidium curvatum]|nr:hypothetical protein DFJ74DRAFT_766382 [Hyaloraphidium curvatum]
MAVAAAAPIAVRGRPAAWSPMTASPPSPPRVSAVGPIAPPPRREASFPAVAALPHSPGTRAPLPDGASIELSPLSIAHRRTSSLSSDASATSTALSSSGRPPSAESDASSDTFPPRRPLLLRHDSAVSLFHQDPFETALGGPLPDLLPAIASSPPSSPSDRPEKPKAFRCTFPGCDKSFTTSGHLSRHRRNHAAYADRPFACPVPGCPLRFTRTDNLRSHYRSHARQLGMEGELPEGYVAGLVAAIGAAAVQPSFPSACDGDEAEVEIWSGDAAGYGYGFGAW